ncbi:unnamed protein product [Zymoseptoria tritici ST99CH_3D1]|nr:unnamed protein product [Zymoseptoria tritici ST99CH_3D1]
MRAIDVRGGAGPASALFINDSVPKPQPKPSECLVKVKAFGLNRADTLQREGKHPVPPGVTKAMGLEFSGVVEEVGSDTAAAGGEDYRVGDEVFGLTYGGAYAEYVAVSKKMLLRKPAELSWEECAAVPELASTPPKVYATTRQDAKCGFVTRQIGARAAFNTTKSYPAADGSAGGTWADEVKRVNGGEGVDLVIDFVGAPYFADNLAVLAKDGRVVQLGVMGGTILPAGVDISSFVMKRASFVGSTLRSRDAEYQGKLRDLFAETVVPKLVKGDYRCSVQRVLSWRKIEEAHGMLEGNVTMGKVVCLVD